LIHKDTDSCCGVSFPDIPGVFTGGDTIDEAMQQAVEVLQFAAEDWTNPDGSTGFKPPSTIDQLRSDPEFLEDAKDAVIAFVEFPADGPAAE
jgi:predicted RNase H-like HicB family nuclease